jgi:hypothetical protein
MAILNMRFFSMLMPSRLRCRRAGCALKSDLHRVGCFLVWGVEIALKHEAPVVVCREAFLYQRFIQVGARIGREQAKEE